MTSKTINLTGTELAVTYAIDNYPYVWLRNDSAAVVYASSKESVTAGSDGVVSIPVGQSACVYCIGDVIYLLGTGSVMLVASNTPECPFKTSTSVGGSSGVDEVARAAISAHVGNADIHVTAAEKAAWNAVNYSNPNLLINPDFRINQRGENSYNVTGCTADCWLSQVLFEVTPLENGIQISCVKEITSNSFALYQRVPVTDALHGSDLTMTANIASTSDYAYMAIYAYGTSGTVVKSSNKIKLEAGLNSVTLESLPDSTAYIRAQFTMNTGAQIGDSLEIAWAKLEVGSTVTPFVPPDPTMELLKCQRYYQIRTTNDVDPLDMRPSMRTITDIKQVTGGYAYVAEL